jgi:hypothetical protein
MDYYKDKNDENKNLVGLFLEDFASAIWETGEVSKYGAKKYSASSWRDVPNGLQRYKEAFMRHYIQYLKGEYFDKESGLPHLSHALWCLNAVFTIELEKRQKTNNA